MRIVGDGQPLSSAPSSAPQPSSIREALGKLTRYDFVEHHPADPGLPAWTETRPVADGGWLSYADVLAALDAPAPAVCKVRAAGKTDPPQDCDWPFCACDPYAAKVVDAVFDSGWSRGTTPLAPPEIASFCVECGPNVSVLEQDGSCVTCGSGAMVNPSALQKLIDLICPPSAQSARPFKFAVTKEWLARMARAEDAHGDISVIGSDVSTTLPDAPAPTPAAQEGSLHKPTIIAVAHAIAAVRKRSHVFGHECFDVHEVAQAVSELELSAPPALPETQPSPIEVVDLPAEAARLLHQHAWELYDDDPKGGGE